MLMLTYGMAKVVSTFLSEKCPSFPLLAAPYQFAHHKLFKIRRFCLKCVFFPSAIVDASFLMLPLK